MKKSFTLIEVVISITIFMILVLFLYKTLDQTKHSNKAFAKKELEFRNINRLNDIFFEDINESFEDIKLTENRDRNSIVQFKSLNTIHNAFYSNITYLINSKNSLVRMESKTVFKTQSNPFTFYNSVYVDELLKDVEYFEVKKSLDSKQESYLFLIKQKNKKRELFNIIKPIRMEIKLTPPAGAN